MIYRRCPRCGKRVEEGKQCACKKISRNQSNRTDGIRKEYHTYAWLQARERCFNAYDHIDIYALYKDGRVIPADRIHHIVEALYDPELFYEPSNHFPTSEESHKEIHNRYKAEDAEAVRNELRSYLKKYRESAAEKL